MEARGALVSDKQRARTQAKASTRASGFSVQPQIDYPSLKLFVTVGFLLPLTARGVQLDERTELALCAPKYRLSRITLILQGMMHSHGTRWSLLRRLEILLALTKTGKFNQLIDCLER